MAWDFAAEIHGLTGFDADSSSTTVSGETYQVHATRWLTDSAKEVINQLPPNLLDWCSSQQTFTSVMPGSEAETMSTGKILRVYRNDGDMDKVCRRIRPDEKGYVTDPDEMGYATVSDPVFYTENNKLNALPEGGSCKYDEVQYPAVAYGDSAISVFPDEAEYLVVLGAAIKAAEYMLSSDEDVEISAPVITGLKTDYEGGIQKLLGGYRK